MYFSHCHNPVSLFALALLVALARAGIIVESNSFEQFNSTQFQKVTSMLQLMTMPKEVTGSIEPPAWLPLWAMLDFMTPNATVYINAVAGIVDRTDLAKAETFNRASGQIMRFSKDGDYRNTTQWIRVEEFWTKGTITYSVVKRDETHEPEEEPADAEPIMSRAAALLLRRVFARCGNGAIHPYSSSICAEDDGQQVCVTLEQAGLACNDVKDILGHALVEGALTRGVKRLDSPPRFVCVGVSPIDCA